MKKILIGALVGGIILFAWQTASWTALNLHYKGNQYTPAQDSILQYLGTQLKEGQFFLPTVPKDAGSEEMEALMKSSDGKPWAIVSYHSSMHTNMVANIIRGLLTDIILIGFFCWMLSRFSNPSFGSVFLASLLAGQIVFLNGIYTMHIWYESFDLMAHFTDALVGWGLTGIWLGWWFRKK